MGNLTIRLLGPIEVEFAGRPVGVSRPKVRALLAALTLQVGRTVSSDRLALALWEDAVPRNPHHALQMHVTRLRQVHPALRLAVRTSASGYRLEVHPHCVDMVRFECIAARAHRRLDYGPRLAASALDAALALWRGDALGDMRCKEFATGAVRRLEELHLQAVEDRCDAAIRLGAADEAIGRLHELVLEHPLREGPIRLLVQALRAVGKPNDAAAAYRAYRARLRSEYGLLPSPTLHRLVENRIRSA